MGHTKHFSRDGWSYVVSSFNLILRNYKEYMARTSLISTNCMPSLIARYWMISQEITWCHFQHWWTYLFPTCKPWITKVYLSLVYIHPGKVFNPLFEVIFARLRVWKIYWVLKLIKSICHPCDIPYNYIVKLETFAEDYQFIMKKVLGLWNEDFTAKHKQVGITIGKLTSLDL